MTTHTSLEQVLQTEHLFDYTALLNPPLAFGRGHLGARMFYEVREGRISGPALKGEILSGGGDWPLVDEEGWTHVDVRGQARTDDGALLYLSYRGVIEPTATLLDAMRAGRETGFDDQYWRVTIEVETGDPRYRWLTNSALVGRGRLCEGPGVVYQVFRVC